MMQGVLNKSPVGSWFGHSATRTSVSALNASAPSSIPRRSQRRRIVLGDQPLALDNQRARLPGHEVCLIAAETRVAPPNPLT